MYPALYARPRMELDQALQTVNRGMIAFDLALGTGAILAPDATLRILGHDAPSDETRALFQRCGPIWLTFAAGHALAAARGRPEDWWALAWLRATEIGTDALWASKSSGFSRPGARAGMWIAGLTNLGMALGFGRLARSRR